MLETYFVAPKTLRRLRSGPSEPYIECSTPICDCSVGFLLMLQESAFSEFLGKG
jgi:hypothetical protein